MQDEKNQLYSSDDESRSWFSPHWMVRSSLGQFHGIGHGDEISFRLHDCSKACPGLFRVAATGLRTRSRKNVHDVDCGGPLCRSAVNFPHGQGAPVNLAYIDFFPYV